MKVVPQGRDLRPAVQGVAETMLTIAADPGHLGGRIGITSAAHLGLGTDPSPTCAHDRAKRRYRARRGGNLISGTSPS